MEFLEDTFEIMKKEASIASVDVKDAFSQSLCTIFIKDILNLNGLINSASSQNFHENVETSGLPCWGLQKENQF